MAASSSFSVFAVVLLIAISSPALVQIHAREGVFVSKIDAVQSLQQQEFVPQNQNGYGLYAHGTKTSKKKSDNVGTGRDATESKTRKDKAAKNHAEVVNSNLNALFKAHRATVANSGKTKVEKKGMSDTRFLENGKYFYDVKNEKKNQYAVVDDESYEKNNQYAVQNNIDDENYENDFGDVDEDDKPVFHPDDFKESRFTQYDP